jgi:predicted PurR-regulated permease PerM
VGKSSELHPVVIIFALLAGEHAFGLVGALLAVAVASIVQTLFVFLLSRVRRPLDHSASTPPTPPHAPPPPAPASDAPDPTP